MKQKLTTEIVIRKLEERHGDVFDYSHIEYKPSTKIKIICKKHNQQFETSYHKFLYGNNGCKVCQREQIQEWRKKDTNQYISNFKNIHGEKYDYSLIAKIENSKDKIPIKCIKHNNIFYISPNNHSRNKSGCKFCKREKFIDTCIKKYGQEHPIQNEQVFKKVLKIKNKLFTLPSGRVINVQGYEDKVLNFIFKHKMFSEKDFDFKIKSISYNTNKKYFPDFFVKSKNLIIEVKSFWTYKQNFKKNLLKKRACLSQGFNFKFYIWDIKNNDLIIL